MVLGTIVSFCQFHCNLKSRIHIVRCFTQ